MVAIKQASPTAEAIFKSYEKKEEESERRCHLGASSIGKPCSREIWYSFRWASKSKFDGRMLRLFSRGHREEPELIADLEAIGCKVHTKKRDGTRFRDSTHGGHYSMELDAVVEYLPESPRTPHLAEFKTANKKSFSAMEKHGVEKQKPIHVAQMQALMAMFGLKRAIYIVVCKDDDRIYVERIKEDKKEAATLRARALRIIESPTPPTRESESPDVFGCRFCDFKELCHGAQVADVNCRTCIHSTPVTSDDGGWRCEQKKISISNSDPCPEHIFIPELIPFAGAVDTDDDGTYIVYEDAEGRQFINSASSSFPAKEAPHHSSKELRAMDPKAAFSHEVALVKKIFEGSEVIG